MRFTLIGTIFFLFYFIGCNKNNDNPVTPQSKSIQIDKEIGWIFSNCPSDIHNGPLTLDITLHYSGASLQPNEISYFKVTGSVLTWNLPITSSNLIDSLGIIYQSFFASSLSSNATVLPIGSYTFELKLANGFDVSQTVTFPAPGSLSTNGYTYMYTEDYSGGIPSTFTKTIRRPMINALTKVNDTIAITFTMNDSLFYNGYIWLYNSSGNYIGGSSYFRNINTKALSTIINNGAAIYSNGATQNVVRLYQQNSNIYSPASFNDIYYMRIVVTDGIQYQSTPGRSYDCRAISLLQHL